MQMREKVGKSRNTVFFQWLEAPEGRKVGSLKWRVRSQLARWEMKNACRCGAKHISKSKCTKHTILEPLLEVAMSWREAHFEVNMYKTHHSRIFSDHFWKLRCRKSARRCGAKHISKSKCTKHNMFASLLEVQMSKKCTPLWREAHFEVKMSKTPGIRTAFGGSDVASLCFATLHSTTLNTLHYTILHYTTLHYITLHYITLNYTAPQIDR